MTKDASADRPVRAEEERIDEPSAERDHRDVLRHEHRPSMAPRGYVGGDARRIKAVVEVNHVRGAYGSVDLGVRARHRDREGHREARLESVERAKPHQVEAVFCLAPRPLRIGARDPADLMARVGVDPGQERRDLLDPAGVRRHVVSDEGYPHAAQAVVTS